MIGKVIFLVVLGLILQHVFKVILHMGVFKHVYHHQPGPCETVPGIEDGSEDMEMNTDGKLFITSGLGNVVDLDDPRFKHMKGQIFLMDTSVQKPKAVPLPIAGDLDLKSFHPHGLSLWKDSVSEKLYVYVVNHPLKVDTVEKFLFDENNNLLQHLKTFSDPAMHRMNDLHVIAEDQFFYTNSIYSFFLPLLLLETLTPIKTGSVAFYDGTKGHVLVTPLAMPNGINISPDHKYLYVSLHGYNTIAVYEILQDNSLLLHESIPVYTCPDNLDVDPVSGDIYVAAQYILHEALSYMMGDPRIKGRTATSQVLRIKMKNGHAQGVEEIYKEDGHLISVSTVGVYRKNKLYIGSVSSKMAVCDVYYIS